MMKKERRKTKRARGQKMFLKTSTNRFRFLLKPRDPDHPPGSEPAAVAAAAEKCFRITENDSDNKTLAALSRIWDVSCRRTRATRSWASLRSWSWPSSISGCCRGFCSGRSKMPTRCRNSKSWQTGRIV